MPYLTDLPEFNLDDAADFINNASCVLFVGPELLRYHAGDSETDESLTQYVRRRLYDENQADINFFHPTEGLFLFKTPTKRIAVKRKITDLYEEIWNDPVFWRLNLSTLQALSQLPFHLIVTVTSDNFIARAMEKFGLKPQTGYFIGGGKPIGEVSLPTKKTPPLVYHLCGSVEDNASILLDYEELYVYLKSVLDRSRLPDNLDTALDSAGIYIFLGFEMHRWQTQLLLQLVQEIVKNKDKFASHYTFNDEQYDEFFKGLFKIAPVGEQREIIQNILSAFTEKKYALRSLKEVPDTPLGV
ncbi:MAG TPA: SIR2 family protein, partial [Saprospiraceae bacterium]|nr:SIR2 family protein [Saprospiraceae bacterium]